MVNNGSLIWEFFAGSRSFSNVCENRGYETYTSDIEPFDRIDEVVDFLEFDVQKALLKTGPSGECSGQSHYLLSPRSMSSYRAEHLPLVKVYHLRFFYRFPQPNAS